MIRIMAKVVKKGSCDSTYLSKAISFITYNRNNYWVNPLVQTIHFLYLTTLVVTCPHGRYKKLSNGQQPEQDCLRTSLFTA